MNGIKDSKPCVKKQSDWFVEPFRFAGIFVIVQTVIVEGETEARQVIYGGLSENRLPRIAYALKSTADRRCAELNKAEHKEIED